MKKNNSTVTNFILNTKNIVHENKKELIIDFILMFLIWISSINGEYTRTTIYILALWGKEIYFNMRYRKNFIMVLFYCTIMFFIIFRPFIGLLLDYHWENYYSTSSSVFVLCSVSVSMLFINYGGMLYFAYKTRCEQEITNKDKKGKISIESKYIFPYKKYLIISSLIIWTICISCELLINVDKLIFVLKNSYVEYYVSYKNTFPLAINIFVTIYAHLTLIVLALKPNKYITILVLVGNIIVSVPILMMGMRNSFLMSLVFTFVYLLYRYDIIRQKMRSKKFIMWACIGVIFLGGCMSFLGTFRGNKKGPSTNVIRSFMNFAYTQGTTFDTIRQAYYYKDKLPDHKSYAIGSVIDYTYYGWAGQRLFKSIDIGGGNNVLKGTQGNSLAHHLSYVVMEDKYLSGQGRGSSYIPELYLDFGYIGVCIGSLILGILIQMANFNIFKGVASSIAYLGIIYNLWLIARSSYDDIFQYLFTFQFWFAIFIVIMLAFVIKFILLLNKKFCR